MACVAASSTRTKHAARLSYARSTTLMEPRIIGRTVVVQTVLPLAAEEGHLRPFGCGQYRREADAQPPLRSDQEVLRPVLPERRTQLSMPGASRLSRAAGRWRARFVRGIMGRRERGNLSTGRREYRPSDESAPVIWCQSHARRATCARHGGGYGGISDVRRPCGTSTAKHRSLGGRRG
jgi:hypothetical protein